MQRPRSVSEQHHVGAGGQVVEAGGPDGGAQVEQRRPLAGVEVDVLPVDLGTVRAVEAQDLGAPERERPPGDRPGEHPGDVEHP